MKLNQNNDSPQERSLQSSTSKMNYFCKSQFINDGVYNDNLNAEEKNKQLAKFYEIALINTQTRHF